MNLTSTIVFQTERLVVRRLKDADFPAFHEMQSNGNVMRYTTGVAQTEEEDRASLNACIAAYTKPDNNFWVWAIDRKSDGAFVGTCAIVNDNNEIGYRFLETYWGNGYGQEITNGLVDHAFKTMGVGSLVAYVNVENVASVKILDRSPLQFVKEYYNEEEKCVDRFYKLEKNG